MGRITLRTTIDASPEVVFDALADIERMPEYSTLTKGLAYITPGPVQTGTYWREENPIGAIPTTGDWWVEEFDRPDRFVFEGEASFVNARVVFDVEDRAGRSYVEQVTTYEFLPQLGPLGRFLDRLAFKRVLAQGQRESMENFKRMVEAEPVPNT